MRIGLTGLVLSVGMVMLPGILAVGPPLRTASVLNQGPASAPTSEGTPPRDLERLLTELGGSSGDLECCSISCALVLMCQVCCPPGTTPVCSCRVEELVAVCFCRGFT